MDGWKESTRDAREAKLIILQTADDGDQIKRPSFLYSMES